MISESAAPRLAINETGDDDHAERKNPLLGCVSGTVTMSVMQAIAASQTGRRSSKLLGMFDPVSQTT